MKIRQYLLHVIMTVNGGCACVYALSTEGTVGSGQRQMAGACECGNEPSGSINCGEFLE
jgi:hypothetical protein